MVNYNYMKYKKINEIVGDTPLIEVGGIYAKLETTNPTGSIKDRMVKYIIEKALEKGDLKSGYGVMEVTSGNTGISLAMFSALNGYKFTAIMPESMSPERIKMMEAFGANVILTPAKEDMKGAVKVYEDMKKDNLETWYPDQFNNKDNITAHETGIGHEILRQTGGAIDAFVAGAGTGGTVIGVARALKKLKRKIRIVVVEPEESAILTGKKAKTHGIQGIGEGFIPNILKENLALIDEILTVSTEDAIGARLELGRKYGVLVGTSSGANFQAALQIKKRYKRVVTVFPDRGERYLSDIN